MSVDITDASTCDNWSKMISREAVIERLSDVVEVHDLTCISERSPQRPTVWRVETGNETFALKIHVQESNFNRERNIYERHIADRGEGQFPTLVKALPSYPPALLLTWSSGEIFDRAKFQTKKQELKVFQTVGEILRTVHGWQVARKNRDQLVEKTLSDCWSRLKRMKAHLPPAVSNWVHKSVRATDWDELPLGMCHHDFSPSNWIVDTEPGTNVVLIDFEYSSVDFFAMDVMKLWEGPFRTRADRVRAFSSGYRDAAKIDRRFVRALAPVYGLAKLDRSRRIKNKEHEAHAARFLERAAASDSWLSA